MINLQKTVAKASYPNCDFYVGDMLKLPFKDNEVLEEFITPPSYFFETLMNNNFVVENFKESRCIYECKEVDEAYYTRFHELPQFMAILAKK